MTGILGIDPIVACINLDSDTLRRLEEPFRLLSRRFTVCKGQLLTLDAYTVADFLSLIVMKQIKRAGQIRHLRYNPAKLGLTARGIAHDNTHDNAIFMAGCKVMGCRIFMSSMMGNFIKSGKAGKMHMSINDFHSYHLLG